MNITSELLRRDPSLSVYWEGDWKNPIKIEDSPNARYASFNDAGLECETGELLYGFIRMLKPAHVLETGTHVGIGASYMGMALKHNGKGQLDTIEFLRDLHERACQRIYGAMMLQNIVMCHLGDAAAFDPRDHADPAKGAILYQMILLDTEPQLRFAELVRFMPYLAPGGYVFIHDLHRHMGQVQRTHPDHPEMPFWPWGEVPDQIKQWVNDDHLRPFHFANPRGLTGFYKPHEGDWKSYT